MSRPRRALLGLVVLTVSLVMTGCQNLQFTQDHRLKFLSPANEETVHIPFTIRWSMKDFDLTGQNGGTNPDAGEFAVFLDNSPMPVGKGLNWVFRSDQSCTNTDCVTAKNLANNFVFVTTKTSLTLNDLPPLGGAGKEQHVVTIVLLNGQGVRKLETSWYRNFQLPRRSNA